MGSLLITGFMAYLMARLNQEAKRAAVQVTEVKTELRRTTHNTEVKLDEISDISREVKKTGDATHTLVNGSFTVQLKISLIALERLAEITGNPKDIEAAKIAHDQYDQHLSKQNVIDQGGTIAVDPERTAELSVEEHAKEKALR